MDGCKFMEIHVPVFHSSKVKFFYMFNSNLLDGFCVVLTEFI